MNAAATLMGIGAGSVGALGSYVAANKLVGATAIEDIEGDRSRRVGASTTHEYRTLRGPNTTDLTLSLVGGGALVGGFSIAAHGALKNPGTPQSVAALVAKLPPSARSGMFGALTGVGLGAIVGAIVAHGTFDGIQPIRTR